MLDALLEALEAVEATGLPVRRGTPATPEQIDALERTVGCSFPTDYRAFLEAVGALHVDDLPEHLVFGHAPGDPMLHLVDAASAVRQTFDEWGQDEVAVTPILAIQHFPTEATVLGPDGALLWLRRGRLEAEGQTFTEQLVEALRRTVAQHAEEERGEAEATSFLDAVQALLPPGLPISIRFGDGRELGGVPGVFVSWQTEQAPSAEALNAWNRRARFVRGAATPQGGGRFRGLLPAEGLTPELLLAALAHDAELPLASAAPPVPSLDAVAEALAPVEVRRDADALLLTSPGGYQTPAVALRVTVGPLGLVHAEHRHATDLPADEVLASINEANGGAYRPGPNLDLENLTRLALDGTDVVYRFTTTVTALSSAWRHHVRALEEAVARAGLAPEPDPRVAWDVALSKVVGCPVGPVTAAVLRAVPFSPYGRLDPLFWLDMPSAPPSAVQTPWGPVVPFLCIGDEALGRTIELGLAGEGDTTDALAVVGLDGDRAVRLADDLAAFVSVAVLGISGVDWDGDAARTWRDFRDLVGPYGDLPEHYFTAGDELCRSLGLRPAADPGDVLGVHPEVPELPPARPAPTAAPEAGTAALDAVRRIVSSLQRTGRASPERKALLASGKELGARDAVAALEAFWVTHADRLVVRHGEPADPVPQLTAAHGKLPVLHRQLLERFGGWLEVRLAAADGPLGRTSDGLRVLGQAPEHAPCDLDAQLPVYRALVAGLSVPPGDTTAAKRSESLGASVPFLTTLAGPRDAWVGQGTRVDAFREWSRSRPWDHRDHAGHPRFGAAFAFVARLVELEDRLAEVQRLERLEAIASGLGQTWWDARGSLRLAADPDVSLRLCPSVRDRSVYTVVVRRRVQRVPQSLGSLDPRVERTVSAGTRALPRGTLEVSAPGILCARTDRLLDGLTPPQLARAVDDVGRMAEAVAARRFVPWDDEDRGTLPDGVRALLAGVDSRDATVSFVGHLEPRVRWSWRPAREPGFGHGVDPWARLWEPVIRDGVAWMEAELPVDGLNAARIEQLLTCR